MASRATFKECVFCRQRIHDQALICAHCNSDQRRSIRWFHFFSSGAVPVLSLLVALATVALPLLREYREPAGSVIKTSIGPMLDDGQFSVLVSNIGKLPASIQHVYFLMANSEEEKLRADAQYGIYIGESNNFVVEPGKTITVHGGLIGDGTVDSAPPLPKPTTTCGLQTLYADSVNGARADTTWFPCILALQALMRAHSPAPQ
jgi:hypothetical protein